MPIKFRCGQCDQLLGIARRKAGAVVDCPTCGAKTIVPRPRENGEPPPKAGALSLLERVDVDKLLAPSPGRLVDIKKKPLPKEPAKAPAARAMSDPAEMKALQVSEEEQDSSGAFDDFPLPLSDTGPQLVLWGMTWAQLILVSLTLLALVAGAFAAGWWWANRPS
jgi:DNA-directed RNA polymerase subunit RPC12/RpoP